MTQVRIVASMFLLIIISACGQLGIGKSESKDTSDPCKKIIVDYQASLSGAGDPIDITTDDYMSLQCADSNDLYEVAMIVAALKAKQVADSMQDQDVIE